MSGHHCSEAPSDVAPASKSSLLHHVPSHLTAVHLKTCHNYYALPYVSFTRRDITRTASQDEQP
jgi:hypothetical protein